MQPPPASGARSPAGGSAGPAGTIILAPRLPARHGRDEVAGLAIEGNWSGKRAVTFGQVFAPGDVPSGTSITARIRGQEVPTQLDVKARNEDGSVRMGIVTVMTDHAGDGVLLRQSQQNPGAPLQISGSYNLVVEIAVHGGENKHYRLELDKLIADAVKAGTVSYWLKGPLASEARLDSYLEGAFHVTFDVRRYVDGNSVVDVQFNNDIAMQPVGGPLRYDVSIRNRDRVVFTKADVEQFQYQTWHREIWSGEAPPINIVHDLSAMARAGAVQNYDNNTGVAASTIEAGRRSALMSGSDILAAAGLTKYMGATGGRQDIGPTTMANTAWLMTGNPGAAQWALAQADAAGSIPWHFRDRSTGTYVTLDHYPKLWTDARGGKSDKESIGLTQPIDQKGSGWSLDEAHEPDLSYVAYLLTGSRYRLDQLNAQASWSIVGFWPAAREFEKGIVVSPQAQVRAQAWMLREILEAAYINPDDSPLKAYFRRIVANNMAALLEEIKAARQGEAYGWIAGLQGREDEVGAISPWMQDYFGSTMVLAAEQGVPGAREVLLWQAHFLANRFLSEQKGFPAHDGANYRMYAASSDGPYQTWREIGAATAAHGLSGGGSAWPKGTFVSYLQAAKGVLGGIITVTDSADAKRALAWLNANAPQAGTASLQRDPTWNIIPMVSAKSH